MELTRVMDPLVKCPLCKHVDCTSIPKTHIKNKLSNKKPGMVAHTYKASAEVAEKGRCPGLPGQPS